MMLSMIQKAPGVPDFTLEEFEWVWKKTQNYSEPVPWEEIKEAFIEKVSLVLAAPLMLDPGP